MDNSAKYRLQEPIQCARPWWFTRRILAAHINPPTNPTINIIGIISSNTMGFRKKLSININVDLEVNNK